MCPSPSRFLDGLSSFPFKHHFESLEVMVHHTWIMLVLYIKSSTTSETDASYIHIYHWTPYHLKNLEQFKSCHFRNSVIRVTLKDVGYHMKRIYVHGQTQSNFFISFRALLLTKLTTNPTGAWHTTREVAIPFISSTNFLFSYYKRQLTENTPPVHNSFVGEQNHDEYTH